MIAKLIANGIASYIPGLKRVSKTTGGSDSARYCYSVWLRHLVMAHTNGLPTQPDTAAELGPGDSLGIGLAALLSGVNKYYAFDVVKYVNTARNLTIFEELAGLFGRREGIPGRTEFPAVKPYLDSYEFPGTILTEGRLRDTLRPERIRAIRDTLSGPDTEKEGIVGIAYYAPWYDLNTIPEGSVDMVFSQTVLQHIDDIDRAYTLLYRCLKRGGYMSHQIDLKCLGTAKEWNGHWAYSDIMWKLIKGKRRYLINREPHSAHITGMQNAGFEIVCDIKIQDVSGIARERLAPRFRDMSDEDLVTSGAFIQAIKR